MDTMDEAHRKDSKQERAFRDVVRAIDTALRYEDGHRLSQLDVAKLVEVRRILIDKADHIVAVWD